MAHVMNTRLLSTLHSLSAPSPAVFRESEDHLPAGCLPLLAAQCPSSTGTPWGLPAPCSCSRARPTAMPVVGPDTGNAQNATQLFPCAKQIHVAGSPCRAGCAAISHKEDSDLYRSVSVIGSGIRYEEDVLKAPIMSSVFYQKKEFLSSGIQFFVEI